MSTEAELRAFVGPNADYYLQTWAGIAPDGKHRPLRGNWAAFFLNIVWLLHRRMYRQFWIGFGVLAAIGIVEGAFEELLHAKAPAGTDIILSFTFAAYFGNAGNWLYYRHATSTIARIKAQDTNPEALVRAGGVRWLWPTVVGASRLIMAVLYGLGAHG